jgi:mono/diheme cytochrome c family protein
MLFREIGIFTLLCVVLSGVNAQGIAQAQEMEVGQALYEQNCASCHGPKGKGDGVMTKFLNIEPTDLTRIAQQNDGIFPHARIFRIIDGRETVRAHGETNMPVWGYSFGAGAGVPEDASAREKYVAGQIAALAFYIATIQERD